MRGGLKGKTALGDAHPYLALFYLSGGARPSISVLEINSKTSFLPLKPMRGIGAMVEGE